MIKTIIFDNNGVLTTCDNDRTIPNLAEYFNVDVEYLRPNFHEIVKPADLGKITTEEFFLRIAKFLDKDYQPNELWDIIMSSFIPLDGVTEILEKAKANYEIALLTNFLDCFDLLNQKVWHYEKYFKKENIFVSAKIGLSKPDPRFYIYALKKLNKKPSEILFIDDRESNLVPAKNLGMNTYLFTSVEELKKKLEYI